jgi:hypothetical protein
MYPIVPRQDQVVITRPLITSQRAVSGLINSLIAIVLAWIPLSIVLAIFSVFQINKANEETSSGSKGGHGITVTGLYTSAISLVYTFMTTMLWVLFIFGAISDPNFS